jgi:hypothetical protein
VFHQQPVNQASVLQPQQNQAPVIPITAAVDVEEDGQEFSFKVYREKQLVLHSILSEVQNLNLLINLRSGSIAK